MIVQEQDLQLIHKACWPLIRVNDGGDILWGILLILAIGLEQNKYLYVQQNKTFCSWKNNDVENGGFVQTLDFS